MNAYITFRTMPSSKGCRNQWYIAHHVKTGMPIHVGEGSTKGMWWTNGNYLYRDLSTTHMSGFRNCGVQLYNHPTHGDVYLVYNLYYQQALPVSPTPTPPPPY